MRTRIPGSAPLSVHGPFPDRGSRGGFAVAIVVLLLFAIAMSGATAYQLVRIEAELSNQARAGNGALAAATAGLDRFVATSLGVPADSTTYPVGDGNVVVTARRVAVRNATTDVYLLRAEGSAVDPRHPDSPARRAVSQYALLHKEPVNDAAALLITGSVVLTSNGTVRGNDQAAPGECTQAGNDHIVGIMTSGDAFAGYGAGTWNGDPREINLPATQAAIDSLKARWDVLQDPSFDIPFWDSGVMPDFEDLPADSFYVMRATHDLDATSAKSGWGVLIVPGALRLGNDFTWKGIILAGSAPDLTTASDHPATVSGLLAVGLDGPHPDVYFSGTQASYNSCITAKANAALAHLELIEGTWTDEF